MWILPKQLHTSPFVPDTEALISDSTEQSQICAQSLLARSKPSPARTWLQRWKRDSWTAHLSGRILKPSHGPSFVTAWTSSLAATRANPSAQPANASEPKTHDTSGLTYQPELLQCDQVSVSLKTSRDISALGYPTCCKTWQDWVTERRGAWRQRVNAARLTRGKESGSWPSVTTRDHHSQGSGNNQKSPSLATTLEKNWPTISVNESKNSVGKSQLDRNSIPLGTMAAWTTPTPWQQEESLDSWETRKAKNKAKGYNGNGQGTPLDMQVKILGQAAPASPNTLGSRQGLSWPTPQTMDVLPVRPVDEFAESNRTRGGRKNRKALSNLREAVHSPVYWRTPQAQEAGAKVETLFTKDGAPAMPGQRAYRKTPSGKLVLQSQTINQQVEMVQNWATPQAHDAQGPKTPEQIAVMRAKGHGVKNLNEQAQWGTPTARDHKSGRGNEEREYKELTPMVERQQTGKLNSQWVTQLMGLPMGWVSPSCPASVIKNWPRFVTGWLQATTAPTSCDYLETALCRPAQSGRSEFFLVS
jgi:hypothetical protein